MTIPASNVQKQMWLLNQMLPDNSAYNIPSLFKIKGSFNWSIMQHSILEIVARHENLRTTFHETGGELTQLITNKISPEKCCDFIPAPTSISTPELLQSWINEETTRPFNLATGPLLRAGCVMTAEGEHLLLIVMHHIILDLRTKDLMAQELSALYDAKLLQSETPPIVQRTSAADFVAQDQEFQTSAKHESMLNYWRTQIAQAEKAIELPTDNPRPIALELAGAAKHLTIDADLTQKLNDFSRANGTKTFLTLLTAYSVLLHQYSGKKQLTIGVPFSNRRSQARMNYMGCLMNILPITIDFSDSPTFPELLGQIKKLMLLAHRNQEVWYKTIVDDSKIPSDLSRNPLFQAGFTFHPPMKLTLAGLDVRSIEVHNGGSQLDIFAVFWEDNQEIEGYFEFNSTLFLPATIDRYVANFNSILETIVTNPEYLISDYPIPAAQEKHQLLIEWNDTTTTSTPEIGLCGLFEQHANDHPASLALKFAEETYTYQDLNSKANKLAHYLQNQGATRGSLIGIHLDRSSNLLVALLAVLKAGCTYVPLNPTFPPNRLQRILELTEVPYILTSTSTQAMLPTFSGQIICLDDIEVPVESQQNTNPEQQYSPDDLAYVTFTSGSTGQPKGVMVHHGAVTNFLLSMAREPGIVPEDNLLAVTSLSFDISVLELFLPLISGAAVVIAGSEDVVDGARLLELIAENKISIMQATPTTWRMLVDEDLGPTKNLKILCGGEHMPAELGQELLQHSDQVWNMYGPTETTVWSTCHQLSASDSTVLVGKPIDNTQIYIVNQELNPVPIGVTGELYIGGAGVTKGYLQRADLTAAAFIGAPFQDAKSKVIYRTGDLARYLADGTIEVLGRIDHQIKIRGYRIELGEIEKCLAGESSIHQAIVVAVDRNPIQKALVAYLVREPDAQSTHAEIREFLAQTLPEYMIPTAFTELEAMPLTPNGKIDRGNLPAPSFSRSLANHEYLSPHNDLEIKIAAIWQDVLKLDRVGLRDRFFEIGGNSILAVQVAGRLRKVFGESMSVVALFQYPTVESLAKNFAAGEPDSDDSDKPMDRARMRRKRQAQLRKRPRPR